MFKQMKDLKATVAAAPEMVAQAQQLGANAQAMAAANQAAMATMTTASAVATTGPDFDPVAGVSLDLYVAISKDLANVNYDQAQAPGLAAARGVGSAEWVAAVDGWNARMQTNRDVAQRFNALYYGR
jgi:hypothetical protein